MKMKIILNIQYILKIELKLSVKNKVFNTNNLYIEASTTTT